MEMSLCKHKHFAVKRDACLTTIKFHKRLINTTNANGCVQYCALVTNGYLLNKWNGLRNASTNRISLLLCLAHTHFYLLR